MFTFENIYYVTFTFITFITLYLLLLDTYPKLIPFPCIHWTARLAIPKYLIAAFTPS